MADDPDFTSSDEMIAKAREELAAPLDEKALLEPVEFEHPAVAESILFEPPSPLRRPRPVPVQTGSSDAMQRALRARMILGLAIALLATLGVVAAMVAAGH